MRKFLLAPLAAAMLLLHACSPNNVTTDDSLQQYFDEQHTTGSFGLLDNGQGHFTVYNLKRFKDSVFLPASTFKIVNSLIGLETGVISGDKMIIPWNGVHHFYPNGDSAKNWDKDLTMEEAFKASAIPYYQEVARRIGKDTMQHWLDTLGYGSRFTKMKITTAIDTFWLDNSLKVTADEELGLVKKLYFDQLPFRKKSNQDIVKRLMLQESNANYSISYKTGWGFSENGHAQAWAVGWIEENRHPYFFSLNIEGAHDLDVPKARTAILNGILKQLGFFEGKK
ncbi:penicillin-binding transpeptidase domain-containing protein [Deminuibacter soli]|uniref:Beta-lactamase n=1 Tax=Deminuibacter soli TaxID=2291815 RepID=A0A3E1NPJ9_9BACT|nr:penicillin-binding transpeptidase domain-containing protein [Deminuibacter soli]RFM29869.1 class D beta-lactamase [Deminuibacter soli]